MCSSVYVDRKARLGAVIAPLSATKSVNIGMRLNTKVTVKAPRPPMLTVMAHDPGSANYGFAVVRAQTAPRNRLKVTILKNGLCPDKVKVLKSGSHLRASLLAYRKWYAQVVREYNVQFLVAERFMTRGGKGPTIEAINMMLGVLLCGDLPCKVMPASQWKNAVRRAGVELDDWYTWAKITPHQLDACLIGVYMASVLYGHKGFDGVPLKTLFKKLVLEAEKTSTEPLINRVRRK